MLPFGDTLHYSDARATEAAGTVARELRAYLEGAGFPDAGTAPIAAGIEDTFMALMGAPEGVQA